MDNATPSLKCSDYSLGINNETQSISVSTKSVSTLEQMKFSKDEESDLRQASLEKRIIIEKLCRPEP
jgi:hypothetical protein